MEPTATTLLRHLRYIHRKLLARERLKQWCTQLEVPTTSRVAETSRTCVTSIDSCISLPAADEDLETDVWSRTELGSSTARREPGTAYEKLCYCAALEDPYIDDGDCPIIFDGADDDRETKIQVTKRVSKKKEPMMTRNVIRTGEMTTRETINTIETTRQWKRPTSWNRTRKMTSKSLNYLEALVYSLRTTWLWSC